MKKRFLALALAFALVCPYPAQAAAVEKNETVYALLGNNGAVKEVQVVNWAHGTPEGDSWTDYGSYREVNNSTSSIKPKVDGNRLTWPSNALKDKGLFYQGRTDKELPFNVNIDYTLDGKPIEPGQLAGKNGDLKIQIHLENLTKQKTKLSYKDQQGKLIATDETLYTPFAFQVSTSLPAGKWKDIKSPGANQVVVGDKIQVAWLVFPLPKEEISLEMRGTNIELNPFEITAIPSVLPLPELEMAGGLNQLITGFSQMERSLQDLGSASQKIANSADQLASGCSQVSSGLGQLEQGVKGAHEGSAGLAGGLEQLRSGHEELAQLTEQFVGILMMNPNTDPQLLAMAQGINKGVIEEKDALKQFSGAASQLNSGLGTIQDKGIKPLAQRTPALSSGMQELAKGQEQIAGGISAVADGMGKMRKESGSQYNELMYGQAATDEIQKLAEEYRSFMDNTNNRDSQVQFILRTEGIEMAKPQAKPVPEESKTTVWESIVNFFQRIF